jgi:tetratricopeptide (TPR) repeat protein
MPSADQGASPADAPEGPEAPVPDAEEVATSAQDARASAIERCLALVERGRFADAAGVASAALSATGARQATPRDAAALWGLLGRARERLGEHEAARNALERAIALAPDAEREGYRVQLASLGLAVASDILTRCRGVPDERRASMLRDALTWLERAQRERPADEGIAAARMAVNTGYSAAQEHAVRALVQQQQFGQARRRLAEILRDAQLSADGRAAFGRLYADASASEIAQLAGTAVRETEHGRHWDAQASLEQAEATLTEAGEALDRAGRDEASRRLWLAYTTVGARLLETGDADQAVAPLLAALHHAGGDATRRAEPGTRLVQALGRLVEARAPVIQEASAAGEGGAARREARALAAAVDSALAAGVPEAALASVRAAVRDLIARVGD